MKIAYSWLKDYLPIQLDAATVSDYLTDIGLEVEGVEEVESIKGGLKNFVIGEVLTCAQHENADKLSVTTVNIGENEPLNIVCGAPNVAAGQKVVVATVGAEIHLASGESFTIKKSKIRGAASEGMICAEDELGLGTSHDGILVLPAETPVGMPAAEYFNLSSDFVFEIGLTPNRADAMSHYGVARDLYAVLVARKAELTTNLVAQPKTSSFSGGPKSGLTVEVQSTERAPRYAGVCISNIQIKESPDWLKNRLKAIGVNPINNVVDVTNYICHDLAQPLHAFDLAKIAGNKIVVREAKEGEKFVSLDGIERTLSTEDLMICDAEKPMCIGGVFGGLDSGVSETTTSIFLESAYFNPVSIRKSAKRHGLNTDASFRFERGIDPQITIVALEKAAQLIQEVAGGTISSEVYDVNSNPATSFTVEYSIERGNRLIGKAIPEADVLQILELLDIKVVSNNAGLLTLEVPAYRVDVQREIDVVEEILRIYGFNSVDMPEKLTSSISSSTKPDPEKIQATASAFLIEKGFVECMSNSLSAESYLSVFNQSADAVVKMLNPLSNELNVMRFSLMPNMLENIQRNQNNKRSNLRLFEFGKVYGKSNDKYFENKQLSITVYGNQSEQLWNSTQQKADVYWLIGIVEALLGRLGLAGMGMQKLASNHDYLSQCLQYKVAGKVVADLGIVHTSLQKAFDVKQPVYFATLHWDAIISACTKASVSYQEVVKYPSVQRDLALVVDKNVEFGAIEIIAQKTGKKLLKSVKLFDVYEGDKIAADKKSYAVNFEFQDAEKTLTDAQIDGVMKKLLQQLQHQLKAELRS